MSNIIINSIDVRTQKPLENKRGPVRIVEDLYKLDTWLHDTYTDDDGNTKNIVYAYNGMVVPVIGTRELWMLVDVDNITSPGSGSWVRIGGIDGGGGNIIYDGGRAGEIYLDDQVMDAGNADASS